MTSLRGARITRSGMAAVACIAASTAGYAERSMYRLLRNLYERLGVNNRHEAIVVATRRGLL